MSKAGKRGLACACCPAVSARPLTDAGLMGWRILTMQPIGPEPNGPDVNLTLCPRCSDRIWRYLSDTATR